MVNQTARDRVWIYALSRSVRNGKPSKPTDIANMADVSERTARECLFVMSNAGWLRRRTKSDGQVEYVSPDWLIFDEEQWEGRGLSSDATRG
jgi:DNA-binding FadR family transcriptional regulator